MARLALLAFAAVLLAGTCSAVAAARPNFIIIMADDMGYADASCYGNTRFSTPHLDRLAAGGLKFTDFHSNAPACSPTRAALLTGRYQQRTGIEDVIYASFEQNRHQGLQPREISFSKLLKLAGYTPGLVGKWHLGYEQRYSPLRHGFQLFRGYVSGNIDYHSHYDRMGVPDWWQNTRVEMESGYVTHLITKHAVTFIEQNRKRPFCLYLAHGAPHAPYQGPNDPAIRQSNQVISKKYAPDHVERAYREMMQALDQGVGDVVEAVKRLGLEANTLIFFTSDNGANRYGNNGPLRGGKGTLWEGGHRVPAIAYWPGKIKPGLVTDQLAMTMDIMPTLLELSGVRWPRGHQADGISLVPLLLRGEPLPNRSVFWDYQGRQAARQGPWKLVREPSKGEIPDAESGAALFNLSQDLSEQNNLAQKLPGRVKALTAALDRWRNDVVIGATVQPPKPAPSDDFVEQDAANP